jgi:DNA-binding response OmpR family regulator
MANILVVDDDNDLRPLLKITLSKLGHSPTLATRGEEGLTLALTNKFDLIILDLMMPDIDGYEITRRLRADARTQDVLILILSARSQPADQKVALEAGADAYLTKPFNHSVLDSRISEMLRTGPHRAARPAGAGGTGMLSMPGARTGGTGMLSLPSARVSVALGLRGGVGTTTVAVNLAGLFARAGRRACLVDLSPSGGHVALQLRLRPTATWADLPLTPNSSTVGQMLVRHDSGLSVLAAPAEPVRQSLPGETFQAVLEVLRGGFTEIVIDAAPILDAPTAVALSVAAYIFLVLTPEVGAVQTAIGTLRSLANLPVPENRIRIVLNQVSPEPGLPQAAVEKALGRPPDWVMPYDRAQAAALTQGTPLVFAQPAAPLVASLVSGAGKLLEPVSA